MVDIVTTELEMGPGKGGKKDLPSYVGIFTIEGCVMSAEGVRSEFGRVMESVGMHQNKSQYRRFHAGVVMNFMRRVHGQEDAGSNVKMTLHEQSGNSLNTARTTYGVSNVDMKNVLAVNMEEFWWASEVWYLSLGLRSGSPCGPYSLQKKEEEVVSIDISDANVAHLGEKSEVSKMMLTT